MLVDVKNAGSAEPSFFALITIFTPLGGMADVISTFSGKSGPRIFKLFELFAGVVSAVRPASLVVLLFLQDGSTAKTSAAMNKAKTIFFIVESYKRFSRYLDRNIIKMPL